MAQIDSARKRASQFSLALCGLNMKSDEFIKSVTPILKKLGFRKTRATWRKDQGESIAVFNVQKSQWDSNDFYINVGLYYHAIGDEKAPTDYRCHIRGRLDFEEPSLVVENAMKWFRSGSSFEDAKRIAKDDTRSYFVVKELKYENTT